MLCMRSVVTSCVVMCSLISMQIFQHYATDLRAVFLFYCQLEQSFADHWPPSMGFPHWMLFCKDSETSNPHGATRGLRGAMATKTLTPNQCEELFGKFSIRVSSNANIVHITYMQ